jgi:glycerol-3-phosphate acyltransferase PlsX
VLDVGANVEITPAQLVEFAVLGEAFHRAVHGEARPTVGLLNVGQEELKGSQMIRDADAMLREAGLDMDYRGFVEGDDISAGSTNVVVTDGFTGNVALKTAEGTARLVGGWLREALTSSLPGKLAAGLLSLGPLAMLRSKMDPRSVNGGVFLGLNGVVVKSHGGADAMGFATSLRIALEMADSQFLSEIENNLARLSQLDMDALAREGQSA